MAVLEKLSTHAPDRFDGQSRCKYRWRISMENVDEEWLRTVALNMCWICAEQLHGAVALADGAGELF